MSADTSTDRPVVETIAGAVRGFRRAGSDVFLGIPYAEVPFGERRFAAPEPRAAWSGVRDALAYGPTPQRRALAEVTAIPEPSIPGEDVLSVNVFTPTGRRPPPARRPGRGRRARGCPSSSTSTAAGTSPGRRPAPGTTAPRSTGTASSS